MNKLKMMLCVFIAGLAICAQAQTTVNPGDDLNSIINNSSGETITVNSGTYGPLLIEYKNFSANNPLIIKAADGADVTIKRSNWDRQNPHTQSYDAAVFTECSYIAFDNIKFTGGGQAFSINDRGVWIHDSHHMIFRNCEFTQTQQEGVKVEANSEYIDFIDCLFANTGLGPQSWYGEGLYVGRGSYNSSPQNWPDVTKYVWVEGCEFHHTGRGEAINIKAEAFYCTIKDNYIHDITLNDDNSSQTNEGAISLDHNLGYNGATYQEGARRENWVENNRVEKVRTGKSGQRIAGIYSAGTGNNIVGNTVNDVTNGSDQAAANGIRFNNWSDDNTQNKLWNNTVTNAENDNALGNLATVENPGNNPNNAQSWYPGGSGNALSWATTPTSISYGDNQITLDYSIDQNGIVLMQLYDSNWNYLGQVYQNISSGAGQSTLTLNVDNNLPTGNYRLRAELRNASWSVIDGTQITEEVTLSDTPPTGGNSLSWNPTPTSISYGDNQITLDYSIDQNGIVLVQLYDANWNYLGQVYENISSGAGQSTLTLNVDNNLPAGNYRLRTELRNSSWSVIDGTQLSEEVPLNGTPPISGNSLSWNPTPTNISYGNNQITFNYSVDQDGIVLLQLYSGWNYIGQVFENISSGAGQSTLTLNVDSNLPTGNYRLRAELRNSSWSVIDGTQLSEEVPLNGNAKIISDLSQNIHLSPNPTKHNIQLTCEISENTQAQIHINDAFGKLVKHISQVEILTGSPTEVEVANLPAGMYFCTVQSDKWQAVKKFVIAR